MDLSVFDAWESEVRGYIRSFPVAFDTAQGSYLHGEDGHEYLDFFAGAGALNYGHNNRALTPALLDYLARDGIVHGLDLATSTKREFIETFRDLILTPRGLTYRLQFTGPTGANAAEAAIKLARQVTGRTTVIAFTHGYHGLSLGALAATAARKYRLAGGTPLAGTAFLPYDGYYGPDVDTMAMLERQLDDPSSGLDLPAAILVECVQGEGGVNVATAEWLTRLSALATRHSVPLIVDDIQAGCGRTGDFFSFEESGIRPDIVLLSKSLSGYGLPMSLVMIDPELDVWTPGGHTGTFRGNNLAFVGATAALRTYWADDAFGAEVRRKGALLHDRLVAIAARHPELDTRGRRLFRGLVSTTDPEFGAKVSRAAFAERLIIETAGSYDEVVKFLPALTIDDADLLRGVDIVERAVEAVLAPTAAT